MAAHQAAGHSDTLAAFRAVVLADAILQAQLGAIEAPEPFANAAIEIATRHGLALTADMVAQAICRDPLGVGRWMPAPLTLDRWPGRGWRPARSVPTGAAPAFDWAWFGAEPPAAPFYEDSVRRMTARPFNQMFRTRTTLGALVAGMAGTAPAPAGFVFHMSRCGSTLVAQMLAAVGHHTVLSEPEPLDAVIQWAATAGVPRSAQVAALRATVAALAGDHPGRLFVKLDSWHTLALPLLRAAFPCVPWIFLYRDPIEVMVSQRRAPGIQCVAGGLPRQLFGIAGEEMSRDDYCAQVLARICRAVLDHWSLGGGLLIDYADLPGAMAARIPAHFGFAPDAAEAAAMASVTGRHAKTPHEPFVPDAAGKRASAAPEMRAAATDAHLDALHTHLHLLDARQTAAK